jgi:hypothetical protein
MLEGEQPSDSLNVRSLSPGRRRRAVRFAPTSPTRWASDRPHRRRRSPRCADAAGRAPRGGRSRRCRIAVVLGVARDLTAFEGSLDLAADRDQLGTVVGHDAQPEALRGRERVDRAAVGHIDLRAARGDVPGHDERRHVPEADALDRPGATPHSGDDAPGRHVDRDLAGSLALPGVDATASPVTARSSASDGPAPAAGAVISPRTGRRRRRASSRALADRSSAPVTRGAARRRGGSRA